jgi:hypothetical protein
VGELEGKKSLGKLKSKRKILKWISSIIDIPCNRLTVQYLIKPTAHVTTNNCYSVMFLLRVSAPIGHHLQGGHLKRTTFTIMLSKIPYMKLKYNVVN